MEPEELEQLLLKIMQDFPNTGPLHSGLGYDEIKSRLMPFTVDEPGGIDAVARAIDAYFDTSVNTGHPGFLRAFWGPSEPSSIVASLLSDVRNTAMHSFAVAPSATIIETEMVKAISNLAGFPGHGIFTTGGSNSNEMGFLCAREDALPGSSVTGLSGQNLRAFASAEAHYSVDAAANMMGIGTKALIRIPCIDGQMDPLALEEAIIQEKQDGNLPFIILSTAGTTVSAADAAIAKGANSVTVVATHGVLSGPAVQRLNESVIDKLIVTDTILIPEEKQIEKIETVSAAGLFAEAISRVHDGESLSALFEF